MIARLIGTMRRIRGDERGASAIEFGLFAPILAGALMGVTDVAMGYASKLALEQAAYRSLENVQVRPVQTSYSYLQAEAATAAGVPTGQVTVANWLECNRVAQSNYLGTCPSGEETSRYVRVTITSSFRPRFSYGVLPTVDGVVPLTASATVRVQ